MKVLHKMRVKLPRTLTDDEKLYVLFYRVVRRATYISYRIAPRAPTSGRSNLQQLGWSGRWRGIANYDIEYIAGRARNSNLTPDMFDPAIHQVYQEPQ